MVRGENVTLKMTDFNEEHILSSPGKFKHLNVGFEAFYIGGVPESIKERISKQLMHVQNATSLRGCSTTVYINSELRDLHEIEYSHKVSAGCISLKACRVSQCHGHGECKDVFKLSANFECSCAEGWSGERCDKPVVNVDTLQYRAIALSSKRYFNSSVCPMA